MTKGSFNVLTIAVLLLTIAAAALVRYLTGIAWTPLAVLAAGMYAAASPRIIQEWERGILLRFGTFKRVLSPGVTWVIPGIETVSNVVDMRIRSTSFSAEKTLTRDTVPVNVDAVLFWVVTDAEKAILEVKGYLQTISWAAQTTLRDVIGKSELVNMISDREALDAELQKIIDAKTSEWGITVQSVEIRDVRIPADLEDAMSRKAQAEREKQARIILAESEEAVAAEMEKASDVYAQNRVAMQLRAMNMTYESIKEKGALMVLPSNMVDSVNAGGAVGVAAAGFEFTEPSAS